VASQKQCLLVDDSADKRLLTDCPVESFREAPMSTISDTQERRQVPRESLAGEPARSVLESLVVGSYREMPGLILTLPQAARLFGLKNRTCRVVLDDLVRQGHLRLARDGQYAAA
jgi:hypothetical protein